MKRWQIVAMLVKPLSARMRAGGGRGWQRLDEPAVAP